MNGVKVSKKELLKTLKKNREEHEVTYDKAMAGYRKAVTKELKKRLKTIEGGGKVDLAFRLPEPPNYADEYTNAIAMVEWHTEAEIELDEGTFRQWVLNEFDWRHRFLAGTQQYVS